MSESSEIVRVTADATVERRKRRLERKSIKAAEAREFQKFGMGVMRANIRELTELGMDIEKHGIKNLGHGKIALAGDNAQGCISDLLDIVHEMRSNNPPAEPKAIIAAMALLKGFNEQLMDSGRSHIAATKQVEQGNLNSTLTIPFPAGTPMVIGVSTQKPLPIEGGADGA